MQQKLATMFTAGLVAVAVAACGDSTGPGDTAFFNVHFATDVSGSAAAASGEAGAAAVLSLDAVESIDITLTGVDAVGAGDGFISLAMPEATEDATIDLLDLPADLGDATAGIQLSRGTVPAGTYTGVRLRFDAATATITLNQDVTVGPHTFTAGTHPLIVPSGAQTGIKVPFTSITLGEDDTADVVLTFDAGTTVRNIVATGAGSLMLTPVLLVRTEVEEE